MLSRVLTCHRRFGLMGFHAPWREVSGARMGLCDAISVRIPAIPVGPWPAPATEARRMSADGSQGPPWPGRDTDTASGDDLAPPRRQVALPLLCVGVGDVSCRPQPDRGRQHHGTYRRRPGRIRPLHMAVNLISGGSHGSISHRGPSQRHLRPPAVPYRGHRYVHRRLSVGGNQRVHESGHRLPPRAGHRRRHHNDVQLRVHRGTCSGLKTGGKFLGILGALYAVATVVGPVMGALVAEWLSWHWVFLIIALAGAADPSADGAVLSETELPADAA